MNEEEVGELIEEEEVGVKESGNGFDVRIERRGGIWAVSGLRSYHYREEAPLNSMCFDARLMSLESGLRQIPKIQPCIQLIGAATSFRLPEALLCFRAP